VLPRRLGPAEEIPVPEGFRLEGLIGDMVVGDVQVGDTCHTVLLDLNSRQITETYNRCWSLVSDRWLVGTESAEATDGSRRGRLKVYDRQTEEEYTVEAEDPVQVGLSGDVVVWQTYGSNSDIFAQDLRTGRRSVIARRPGAQKYPHISGAWAIYLDLAKHSPEEQVADLWAYNLESGEDRLLGQSYYPLDSSAGTYHALSGSRVVWTTPWTTPPGGEDGLFRVLSLDLARPQDPPQVVMSGDFDPDSLRLFDDILIYHKGWGRTLYDLQRGEPLAVLEQADEVIISGKLVVWEETLPAQDGSGEWSHKVYTAMIEP